jgi:hypothetical protein
VALGRTVRLRLFRRTAVILVIPLLSMTVAAVGPSSAATTAQASCPSVLFLGAHGVGEGGGSGPLLSDEWGNTIQAVWYRLSLNGVGAVPEAVGYPRVPVPDNLTGRLNLAWWVTTELAPSSITGNLSLINDMTNTYSACPKTLFLLAGYSQGAWIIDYVLHYFNTVKGHGTAPKKILANVKGVFLMGDPAWPKTTQTPTLEGVVNYEASVVTPLLPNSVYPTSQDYLANGLPTADFWSICAGGDPICHYDGSQSDLEKNIKIHEGAYTAGSPSVANDGGNWLATKIAGSVG